MMKVSYKNGVAAVSLRQDDGYTAVYPSCTRSCTRKRVCKTQSVARKVKRCTRRVPDFQFGYTVSHQQPARVPVYPPYSGYTVAGCGPWSGLFQQLLNQRRVAWV